MTSADRRAVAKALPNKRKPPLVVPEAPLEKKVWFPGEAGPSFQWGGQTKKEAVYSTMANVLEKNQ